MENNNIAKVFLKCITTGKLDAAAKVVAEHPEVVNAYRSYNEIGRNQFLEVIEVVEGSSKTPRGYSFLHYLASSATAGQDEIVGFLESIKDVDLSNIIDLRTEQSPPSIDKVNSGQFAKFRGNPVAGGYTALHLAQERGAHALIEHLIERGADTSIKDEAGCTYDQVSPISPPKEEPQQALTVAR